MEPLVEEIERSFREIERQLADPDLFNDQKRAVEVSREHKRLGRAHELAAQWRSHKAAIAESAEMMDDDDSDIREMARAQRSEAEEALPRVEEELRLAMIEPDPNDHRDVIVEIRPGAGGDEAAIWAGDLLDMYIKYAARVGLKVAIVSTQDGDAGGYREAFFSVSGEDPYATLKWESGVHRVQRVPQTETQGRIHTSTASVVVRPEMEDIDVHIDMNDIRVDRFRSGGPGGQSVNTTDSAVRLTHLPTGIVASCQNEKSQIQNKEAAMRVLRARIYEAQVAERDAELGEQRRSAIGTGDRAEKIRTYNYPDGRVTDHRIGLTIHQLEKIVQGGQLDDVVDALRAEELRTKLAERFDGDGA